MTTNQPPVFLPPDVPPAPIPPITPQVMRNTLIMALTIASMEAQSGAFSDVLDAISQANNLAQKLAKLPE